MCSIIPTIIIIIIIITTTNTITTTTSLLPLIQTTSQSLSTSSFLIYTNNHPTSKMISNTILATAVLALSTLTSAAPYNTVKRETTPELSLTTQLRLADL